MRYELAVFGKITPIYPSVTIFGSFLAIFRHFAQKWLYLNEIGKSSALKRGIFRKITLPHILKFSEKTAWAMKNLVPFFKSWGNLLPDRWLNFSPHLFPMFLKFGQKSWKNHLFCPPSYSPTLFINRKMIFHFFQRPFTNYFWPK